MGVLSNQVSKKRALIEALPAEVLQIKHKYHSKFTLLLTSTYNLTYLSVSMLMVKICVNTLFLSFLVADKYVTVQCEMYCWVMTLESIVDFSSVHVQCQPNLLISMFKTLHQMVRKC